MQKVLFVITKSYFGGAQRYVFDLASALKNKGWDVSVALGGEGVLKSKLEALHIRTIPIPSLERDVHPIKDLKTFFALLSLIRKERPDVLHVNSAKAGGLGALAGRLAGTQKIIFTMHGFAFNEDRGLLSKKLIAFFTWLTVFLSHKSIAVSHTLEKDVPAFLKNKIAIIRNGVRPIDFKSRMDAREFLIQKRPELAAKNIPDTFWIGTIAELHPIKGLPYAIDAIKILAEKNPNICYVIISGGEMRDTLESRVKSLGLAKNVFLTGFIEDASKYLKAFDIFLLPSLSEGLGYVLLEAGLATLPVVATNVGGIPEIITNDANGTLILPKNPRQIADALSIYMNDSMKRDQHANNLLETVRSNFSSDRMIAETIDLYEK